MMILKEGQENKKPFDPLSCQYICSNCECVFTLDSTDEVATKVVRLQREDISTTICRCPWCSKEVNLHEQARPRN